MRYFVAFAAVVAGIGMSALEFHVSAPIPKSDESNFLLELCVTFYATVYSVGRLIYALLGLEVDERDVRRVGGWHMLVLNSLLLTLLIVSDRRFFRPSVLVVAMALVLATVDVFRARARNHMRSRNV